MNLYNYKNFLDDSDKIVKKIFYFKKRSKRKRKFKKN